MLRAALRYAWLFLPMLLAPWSAGCNDATLKPITWLQHPPREHRAGTDPCGIGADGGEAGAADGGSIAGECVTDSDCASGKPCGCDKACAVDGGSRNVCLTASNCNTDSNCPTEAPFCSFSQVPAQECNASVGEYATGYFCHTTRDSCADDTDCTGNLRCLYHRASQRWTCG